MGPRVSPERFELDVGGLVATGRLRMAAAIVVTLAGLLATTAGPGLLGWGLIVVGWLVSAAWVRRWVLDRRLVRSRERYFLSLDPDGLRVAEGQEPAFVPWEEIRGADVDEDRLVVVVDRQPRAPLVVPAIYQGGLYAVAEAIARGAETAGSAPDRSDD